MFDTLNPEQQIAVKERYKFLCQELQELAQDLRILDNELWEMERNYGEENLS